MTRSFRPLSHSPHDAAMATTLNHHASTHRTGEPLCYCAGVPSTLLREQHDLIDQIVQFAFDTLGVQLQLLHVRDDE